MAAKIRVVSGEALSSGPPTAGMVENQAFTGENVWVGEIRTKPGATSDWHDHGHHTTYGSVISGRLWQQRN